MVYQKLMKAELDCKKIEYEAETPIRVKYEGNFIRDCQMDFL
ncbi:hypothetical protein DRQ00_02875 [candidate division KSB1 bacterium]|nr:MAG: hypothetical protein DRQ00_02875 [candidate division KSB1 bacterium]RKY83908.1 MAG: hypothetical protein DRQ11_12330 [candidate division KSB1 bacterium]